MANNTVTLQAKGLYTFANSLSFPKGALVEALNVIIDRDNIIEPRRGFKDYGDSFGLSTDRIKQLINYKNRILRHVNSEIEFDSDGAGDFQSFVGSVNEIQSGLRIKSIESNGNLYFTSSLGIRKISAGSTAELNTVAVENAGGVKALDIEASPDYSTEGFLTANSKTAYRVVWGKYDNNDNLILGSPSNREVVENAASTSCKVAISITIPPEVTVNDFYQVYRTGVFPNTTDPGEEFNLVFEDYPTPAEITAGVVLTEDITPEDFRQNGTLLYTNPTSGEGILQANEKPPFAKDITLYKGYTFFGNTYTYQRLNLAFLSVDSLISGTSTLTITDGTNSLTYTFRGTNEHYTINATGAVNANFTNAGSTGRYFTLISSSDEKKYIVWFKETNETEPILSGYIPVQVDILVGDTVSQILDKAFLAVNTACNDFNFTGSGVIRTVSNANNGPVTIVPTDTITNFTIVKDSLGTGEDPVNRFIFLPRTGTGAENAPTIAEALEQIAKSFVKSINKQTGVNALVYSYYLSGFNDVPGKFLLENRSIVGAGFYITANSSATGNELSPAVPTTGNSVISSNEVKPNRIYYSKYQQPDAVPIVNYIDIGPKDKEIQRIIGLRDGLLIFKEDGIYRLTGDVAPFAVSPFDFSVLLTAPDSAVILNNQVFCLTTQGVIACTDTGVNVMSRNIENILLSISREGFAYKTATFGVAYESDRAYHLWTVESMDDVVATVCYRFNSFTNSWTRWNLSATAGIVNFADNKLYLGSGTSNFTLQERKTLTRTDHADNEFIRTIQFQGVDQNVIELGSVSGIEIGDVVIQTQYLTISKYNQILKKLDSDITIGDGDYFSTLEFFVGETSRTKIEALATKMDSDSGIIYSNFSVDIDDYTQTITSTTPGSTTVLNFASNDILNGRYISISGSNTTPNIDGTYEIIAAGPTSVTINVATTSAGTMGTVQTLVNDERDVQRCFNIMMNILNSDDGVFQTNFPLSTGTIDVEGIVQDINTIENLLTMNYILPYINADVTIYKAISTEIIWAPESVGDPSIEKQFSEGTFMFQNSNFSTVSVSYGTDLSPAYIETIINSRGNGDWGQFVWGEQNWGGQGAPLPLRTYVPRQKQRARFMNVRFEHKIAFEKYSLYGVSLRVRPFGFRAYR